MTPQNLSRRAFLKGGLKVAATMAAATGTATVASAALPQDSEESLVTLIDITKCIGCEECVHACRASEPEKYPDPKKPFPKMVPSRVPVEDWSDKKDVTHRLTPYNWLYIQEAAAMVDGEETIYNIPRRCMHCQNPPCVKLCPWRAAKQEKNGLSRMDPDICLGGSKCNKVCPWDIPQRQTGVGLYLDLLPAFAGNGVMYKCDRCHGKLKRGEIPACIEACPEGVQTMGPRSEMVEKARDLAREMDGYIYGMEENGGTNTFYVSPVPFDKLRLETGKGKPHLNPAEDVMADGNKMVLAMAIAPIAGAVAALGKFYGKIGKGEGESK